ncbi:restriction endonuclease subunit S [Cellulophaga baltica]|uniref:restriction endonuclease subunit S n=1 Tax=Cellulophaga baltica TaxID=76594 RepID=UPI002148F13A|nr:restriction endonuclease subunit S [Cellulophaga baltica]MCR1026401.1 restriction endonuclease subunit S [Cellulophaga baltica]
MKDWKKVKLGTLLTESKVVSERPNTDKRLRVKLNVLGVEKRPVTKDKKGATKYYLRKAGQFVYGKQNLHKGAFGIVPEELDGFESSSDIPAFDIDESCYPEWIFYFFKKGDFYLKLESLAKGVGSKRIHPKQIFELDIFLPPKEEQRKVLDEIEKAENNNKELVSEIDFQEGNLTKFRQSILQDAVQGKLTKEWREKKTKLEPASELLKKIKAKKEQLIKEKKIKKEKPLPQITKEEIPFEIPKSWVWCRFNELVRFMAYGTSQKTNDNSKDIPVLRMGNITSDGNLKLGNLKYISPDHKDLPKLFLEKGDLVFNRTNSYELVGKSAVYNEGENKYTLASYLIKVSPFVDYVNSEYINNYIISPPCRKTQIEPQITSQTNQANFSGSKLKNILVPLPSKKEQDVIIEKVNQLMASCDFLEQEIKANKANVEKLMQSVLSELLGEENNVLVNKPTTKRVVKKTSREIKYNSKTLLMDLVKLLQKNGKLHAEDLWKMSKFPNDIDAFYAELKKQIEEEKAIKEVVNEKGYLELA